jgi:hypothetical protein
MANQTLFNEALDLTQRIWKIEPMRNIPMPQMDGEPVKIDALWTDGGLRPNANVLAFFVQPISSESELEQWKQRLEKWPIRGGLLVSSNTLHLVKPSDFSNRLEEKILDINAWRETLISPKPELFTPKALSQFRQGQLSLADLEDTISERSFSFLLRQQEKIDKAFQKAIKGALEQVKSYRNSGSSRNEIEGHVIRVAIAYLAARILQDKGFFGADGVIQSNEPLDLLHLMVTRTNGFFSRALDSAQNYTNDPIRQQLALHMGQSVSFVLTNHRDVGSLYEKAIIELPNKLNGNWGDLNRHYTPIKVAERMLELLPLERIRPEERFIFDPAAGSGSLLLAATARLAQMSDIPSEGQLRRDYLASHVIGNDLDRDVNLITQLRYFLARESTGISDLLPSPNFYGEDYESLSKENIIQKIGNKPRILIANPPFEIRGDKQLAFEFVKQSINWLDEGSQFAFILPSSFVSGKNYGALDIRKSLSEKCKLFDVCRYPERTIGIDASQDVSIVIGETGQPKNKIYTISRSVISRAEASEIRDNGYLGTSWITEIDNTGNWSNITASKIHLSIPTTSLLNLFFVFKGVQHRVNDTPVSIPANDRPSRPTWRMGWRKEGSVWADPERVDPLMRWVIYDSKSLERPRFKVAHLFEKSKILVSNIANTASNNPLPVQLDTIGFCPNNNIWCILPIQEAQKTNKNSQVDKQPQNWNNLSIAEQRLWLLGILNSELAIALSMTGRGNVVLTENILLQFQLPLLVDRQIIDIMSQMVERDQNREAIPDPDPMRQELNRLVEQSYGNPTWAKRQRTGKSPELKAWQEEQKRNQTLTVIGQVLDINQDKNQILLRLSGLLDDNEDEWIPLPQELPSWALDGTVFRAELTEDIETFEELSQRPWALRKFRHTPYPYLTNDELKTKLSRMTGRENF